MQTHHVKKTFTKTSINNYSHEVYISGQQALSHSTERVTLTKIKPVVSTHELQSVHQFSTAQSLRRCSVMCVH